MSRQNKNIDKDRKLQLARTSDSSTPSALETVSKKQHKKEDGQSIDQSESELYRHSSKLLNKDSKVSICTDEGISCRQPKHRLKMSGKKQLKNVVSLSKTKQKRKKSSKRRPKFPMLQKDPPIEEQILSLPAIALAPSLLASIVINNNRYHLSVSDAKAGGQHRPKTQTNFHIRKRKRSDAQCAPKCDGGDNYEDDGVSLIQTFSNILKARGHNEKFSVALEGTEYDVVPSPLQLASYGAYLVWATQSPDPSLIRKLLNCGLSSNPCNQFRDSILGDLVCKQGNLPLYKCFVDEFQADIRVIDGFGRTLLHHCCWAYELCRPIVEDILQRDPIQIFVKDKQEKTPLEYVRADSHMQWKRFLKEVADKYWPASCKLPDLPSFDGRRQPNGDLLDPPQALTPALAAGVSSGKITPEAASAISEISSK